MSQFCDAPRLRAYSSGCAKLPPDCFETTDPCFHQIHVHAIRAEYLDHRGHLLIKTTLDALLIVDQDAIVDVGERVRD